jgi:HD-like signal output (HDOD) protein
MSYMSQSVEGDYLDVSRAFSDYIFSDSCDATDQLNGPESKIYADVTSVVETSAELSAYVPILPKQLAIYLDEVSKEDTDFEKICRIVEGDVGLAGETIRIANSPLYRRSDASIESIGKAVAMLGLDGVNVIATSLMMKQVLAIESKELRHISKNLWSHCLECAEACRLLDTCEDQFAAYLLGLVHDVGAVAIFSCYNSCLRGFDSSEVSHSKVLKLLIEEQSTWLSAHIAKEWKLPNSIVSALIDFDRMRQLELLECNNDDKSELALVLNMANFSSEVNALIQSNILDEETGKSALLKEGIAGELIESVFDRFEAMRSEQLS